MESGKIECTHDFYLKAFHLQLFHGNTTYPPFDFIMIDESGDINEVTLEIFKLLPSTLKVAVGDIAQNIYSFNHTINAFTHLHSEGTMFHMTQSFRVSDHIAQSIQQFCQSFIDSEMHFRGIVPTDTTIRSRAYITRTNGALVAKMIELGETNTPYSLVRKATDIFKLPLMVCNFKYQGTIHEPGYNHLQADIDDWYEAPTEGRPPLYVFLKDLHEADYQLNQAINLVARYGSKAILQAYNDARLHEAGKHSLTLLTSHSSKGLEFDEVTIGADLNLLVKKVVESYYNADLTTKRPIPVAELNELNLAYVTASRARLALYDAHFLNPSYYEFSDDSRKLSAYTEHGDST
jgi:superfamily I DNA/RNA helicase